MIGHRSSIELLDTHPELARLMAHATNMVAPGRNQVRPSVPTRGSHLWHVLRKRHDEGRLSISLPIDALAAQGQGRRSSSLFAAHGSARYLRREEVVLAGRSGRETELYVCRPELAFVQLCAGVGVPKAVELGLQLAGTYRRISREEVPSYGARFTASMDFYPRGSSADDCRRCTVYNVPALTSVARLRAFVNGSPGIYGAGRARKASVLVRDGVRSPLEAEFLMKACLFPCSVFGIDIAEPLINQPIELVEGAARLMGKRVIIPDFSWPRERVVVEILGKRDHDSGDGITETSRREKAYRSMGMTCFTLTAAEMHEHDAFEQFLVELGYSLGHSPRTLAKEQQERRYRLGREIDGVFS